MTKKSPKITHIEGDVNVKDGDVVAGDKTVIHNGEDNLRVPEVPSGEDRKRQAKRRDLKGNLGVTGGDVVFGDKIIKFFQNKLNIYLFKDIKQLAFFMAVVLLVAGGIAASIWYAEQPRVMTGNFNIAVAEFGEIQADGTIKPSSHAEEISSTLFNFLDSEYQASSLGLNIQVAHKNMPLVIENAQAQDLAKEVNADIVIYGNISVQGSQAEFSPRFYVAEHPDTTELTGQNELAYPITFDVNQLFSQDQVNTQLRSRTEILLDFTKGLVYFSQKNPDSANRSLQNAITAAQEISSPFKGEEVIYLLAAQIQVSQKNYDDANRLLDEAFHLNPEYARAHLARGNIYYLQALAANFDVDLLNRAMGEYEIAYQLPNQPEGAYIPIKAHTSMGNVLVVIAQQTNDPVSYSGAEDNYNYVVQQYNQTKDPFLRSAATIAYFGLGAAYERQGLTAKALKAYQQAYDLSTDPDFRSRIEQQIKALQGQ
jgi:tetratricopeptide (TPR) repeat protein